MGIKTEGSGGIKVGQGVFAELKLGLGAVGEEDGGNAVGGAGAAGAGRGDSAAAAAALGVDGGARRTDGGACSEGLGPGSDGVGVQTCVSGAWGKGCWDGERGRGRRGMYKGRAAATSAFKPCRDRIQAEAFAHSGDAAAAVMGVVLVLAQSLII